MSQTNFVVYHHYLSGGSNYVDEEGYITPENQVYLRDSGRDYSLSGDAPYIVKPQDKVEGDIVLESFSGFSVEMGDAAVTIDTSDPDAPKAAIKYESSTPLVILHVYYHYNVAHFSTDFSGDVSNVLPDDQDVVVVDETNLAAIQMIDGLEEVSVGDKIYNTAMGLHTEAYAEVADTTSKNYSSLNEPLNDGRTFDVTLESWFAQNNPTDVGFILDASGSMAFLDDEIDKGVGVFGRDEDARWIEYAGTVDYNKVYEQVYEDYGEYVLLPQEAVDQLLNKNYTDNTSLAYNDYQYYVYDSRDTVQELVPLGYWDGNTGGTQNPLLDGLVGLYQFDRTKVGDDEPNFYKNGAPGGSEASVTQTNKHLKTGSSADGGNGAFQLYYQGDGDPAAGAVVDLDAEVSDPNNFTISFAVKTDKADKINETLNGTGGPQAEDLLTITDENGNELYTILRGTRGAGNSQNHVRWSANGSTAAAIDVHSALSTSEDKDTNYNTSKNKYTLKDWRVFTFVVKDGHVTSYVDGQKATYTKNGKNNAEGDVSFDSATKLKFKLGGSDKFVSGPVLQIDEVYIYGRDLSEKDVGDLYEVSTSTKTAFDEVGAGQYAHFESTGADMLINDRNNVDPFPSQTKLAGWYYVNSTGNYDNIMAAGSAKSLHFLGTVGSSTEKYPTPQKLDASTDTAQDTALYASTDKTSNIAGQTITDVTPCQFYFARLADESYNEYPYGTKGNIALRCIFSPAKGVVEDAPVIVEQVGYGIQNKHKMLDHALNTFIQKLRTAAPGSRLSAVRFSSDSFETHTDELLMQNWTDSETAATGLMSLNRGEATGGGSAKAGDHDTVKDDAGNDVNLYNYVMTGGTYAYTGLLAFQRQLASGVRSDAAKYIVLFTDGADDELQKEGYSGPEGTQAYTIAEQLKSAGFTIFVVRLTSGTVVTSESEDFLKAIASEIGGTKLYFSANSTERLASVFEDDVMGNMPFGLYGYSVRQYIDPRFDLVGSWLYSENIIHLGEGGMIQRGNDTSSMADLIKAHFVTVEMGGLSPRLYYDKDAGLYYLQWDDQTIPRSNVGSNNIYTWQGTMTLRAKEDFIGGDGLLAQGPGEMQNYVFDPDDRSPSSGTGKAAYTADRMPSKGFPRVQLNVQPYSMATVPVVDVRYVGESIDPAAALKALFESAEGEIRDLDHLRHSAHDEPNELEPDGSGYYYEYVSRYIAYKAEHSEYGGTSAPTIESIDAFLADLLAGNEVTLDYSFLPAVDGGTQTGGLENNKLGTITYKWDVESGSGFDDTLMVGTNPVSIDNTAPKRYKLTVIFTADANYQTKVTDSNYNTPKPAEDNPQAGTRTNDAVHTTYVVGGKLALKVEAPTETLQRIVDDGGTLNVTVDGGATTFTLDKDTLEATSEVNGTKTIYLTSEPLPMGSYTLSLTTGDFTGLEKAEDSDYIGERFGVKTGGDVSGYAANADSTPGLNTVTFTFGDTDETSRATARADLAGNLAKWVSDEIKAKIDALADDEAKKEFRTNQTALNDLDFLDPTWDSEADLPNYLNARLGMGSAFIAITPPAEITLTTTKTLTNSEANDTHVEFEFTLTPENGSMPDRIALANFKAQDTENTQKVTFDDPLTFDRPGTYTYTLAEKAQNLEGFTFDGNTHTVQITVSKDRAAVTVDNGVPQSSTATTEHTYTFDLSGAASFTNIYTPPTSEAPVAVTLGAEKLLDGELATTPGQFTFRLWGDNGVNRTATNDETGHISFDSIEYTREGTYTYSLLEEAGSGDFEYDRTVYTIEVTVEKIQSAMEPGTELRVTSVTANGTTVESTDGSSYDLATFRNTTKTPSNEAYIRGTKVFVNGENMTKSFKYKLEPESALITITQPARTASPAQASPAQASSAQASPALASSSQASQATGKPNTGEPNTGEPSMNPKSGFMSIDVGAVPMPEVTEVTTNGSGTFEFGPIEFKKAGNYTYTVFEVKGAESHIYYDNTQYKITFYVVEDPSGVPVVESTNVSDGENNSGSIMFFNTAISKTGKNGGVSVGDTLTYNVSWANFSRESSDVTVSDLFDPGVNFKSARFTGTTPDLYTQDNNLYSWIFEKQDPGDTGSIEIKTEVNEKAKEGWTYTSSDSGLSGEIGADEAYPVVYNQASVTCSVNGVSTTMLTQMIRNRVSGPTETTGSLTISKTVTGDGGEQDRDFHFVVEVPDAADNTYSGVSFENGRSERFTLRSGESRTIEGLPAGARYAVTETEANMDGYTTSSVGAEGIIPAGGTAEAAFTNDKPSSPSSGGEPGPGGGEPGPTDPSVDPPSQDPDTPSSPSQDPDTPTSPSQDPDTPTSPSQDPEAPSSPSQDSGPASGSSQNPDATSSAPSPEPQAASAPGSTDEPLYLIGPGGTSGSGGSGGVTAPVTGDNTPILPLLLLLIVSGVCMVVILRKKKNIDS